ncbi:MAG: chemotaxis response regulator protein-glutamate methylesterase [Candidatus Makaraimicrobium thalassicum]|nr:MAG: chemotaxis response regulator protein-glutamate methylesterase [Candidatus Omnitrophota bacterium]
MSERIRVLIIADSALRSEAIAAILSSDPSIWVIGTARNGEEGREKANILKPDVITIELKTPVMRGLKAIEKIMEESPISIIVISDMDVNVTVKALSIGAMDFVLLTREIEEISRDLIEKVKIAARVKPVRRIKVNSTVAAGPVPKKSVSKVVAIGVSTGGPQALQMILAKLPSDFNAGILIVQHMANGFIGGLAEWLRSGSFLDVRVAAEGDILKSATVFLAPDNYNTRITDNGIISLSKDTGGAKGHVPSVDIMMKSVADSFGHDAVGVIMTGMGRDGGEGIRAIKRTGGITIAQDEKTSVVFGMNKAAIETGHVDKVVPLEEIAYRIIEVV